MDQKALFDHASAILGIARHQAALSTIEEIARALGVTEIQGQPIRQFYLESFRKTAEELICDFADTDATNASKVKAIFDRLSSGKGLL